MSEDGPVAVFAARKSAEKFQDPAPEKRGQGQDRAELDDDAVHFPEAILQIDLEQRLGDAQMRGRADGQKFGQPLDHAEQKGEEIVVHTG